MVVVTLDSILGCSVLNKVMVPGVTYNISSPNYPRPYPGTNYACYYTFIAPVGYRVFMYCHYIDIGSSSLCSRGALNFWPSGDFQQGYNYFCNRHTTPKSLYTTGNKFAARFYNSYPNYYRRTGFFCYLQSFKSASTASATPSSASNYPDPNCKCGIDNSHTRIVNGVETKESEYPWMVALRRRNGDVFCGGSLISDEWVLTAAHCLKVYSMSQVRLILGAHDIRNIKNSAIQTTASEFIAHPSYLDHIQTVDNDIGLIRLSNKLSAFKKEISPICLPYKFLPNRYSGKYAKVMGWGTSSHVGGSTHDRLQQVTLKVYTSAECKNSFSKVSHRISNNMFCAYADGKDACQGDSGGPLVYKEGGRNYLIGIVSWGIDCAKEGYPGVYTQVNNYIRWIEETTKTKFCNP